MISAAGAFRADELYLGWQPTAEPDPGPRPAAPSAAVQDQVSAEWLAAQRREHNRLARPARLTGALSLAAGAVVTAAWQAGWLPAGLTGLTGLADLAAVSAVGVSYWRLWRGRRTLARQLQAEEQRVARFRVVQRDELMAQRQAYARDLRGWQQRSAAFARRPHWQPVTLPLAIRRLEVAGGTLAGWSALLTTMAVARLAAGGEITVVDLTEGDVAADLVAVVGHQGLTPLVWRLPTDLPRLDLGADFEPDVLAEVLARTVAAADGPAADGGAGHVVRDTALLRRVLASLGDGASIAQVVAALRALGQIGRPADHLGSAELTADQLARLGTLAGRGAEQILIDRAWTIESRLQGLSRLATGLVSQPASALRVVLLDGGAAAVANEAIAAYLAVGLTAVLRQSRPATSWQQTVVLLGAERLPADVLDRLCDAAETIGTGLVLGYRSIPAHVRDRIGRGNGAVAFMRLGNATDARLAAEQIGTEHRFVISQLTETVGTSVSDTVGGSATSTVGRSDSVAESRSVTQTEGRSRGHGSSRASGFAPFSVASGSASRDTSFSAALSDSRSVTAGINTGTSWGISTSRAVGRSESVAMGAQRVRELLVEPHELQQLPPSAVVVCHPGPQGRQVLLADANPAIMTLPKSTLVNNPFSAARSTGQD
ncbi:MAG: hypothetical protein J2P27_09570 [Actinobacteria bacterium]|nr:hypothetical protein [Actinomycetota bacterium]